MRIVTSKENLNITNIISPTHLNFGSFCDLSLSWLRLTFYEYEGWGGNINLAVHSIQKETKEFNELFGLMAGVNQC